ncbi:uncharacterized protein Osi10a [Periplaneta americana]|uniref:uncharacterized protein Osi10a n=1 Tax=Periplaneta americana TaxID=6978 RepID=UPI0037E96604
MAARRNGAISLFLLLLKTSGMCESILMPGDEEFRSENANYGFSDTFQHCIRNEAAGSVGNVLPCLSKGAIAGLMEVDERECVDLVSGVSLLRDMDDKSPRTLLPAETDPSDYRTVLEAAAGLFGRRSLRWDMSTIHPGLFLKVGPTLNGAGVLEFVLERGYSTYSDRTAGTGRVILRNILLPLLLGFKLKLVTLIPLMIGVLILVSKKALLLSKIAVFVTTVLGFNSLFFMQQQQQHHPTSQLQSSFGDSFVSLDPQTLAYHNKDDSRQMHSGQVDDFREQVYRERDRISDMIEPKGRRNFLWEESQRSHFDPLNPIKR